MFLFASVSLSSQEFINSVSSQIVPTAPIATVFSPSPLTVVTPPVAGLAPGVLERTALNFYTSVQPAIELQIPVFPAKEHFDIADSIRSRINQGRLSVTTRKPGTPHHFYAKPIEEIRTTFVKKPEAPFPVYGLPSKPVASVQPVAPSIPSIQPMIPPPLPVATNQPQCDFDSLPESGDENDKEVLPSPAVFAPQPPFQSNQNKFPPIAGTISSNKPPLIHGEFHPALPQVIFNPVASLPATPPSNPSQGAILSNNIQPVETPSRVQVSAPIGDNNNIFNSGFSLPDGTKVSEEFKIISTDKWKDVVAKRGSYEYVSPEGIPIKVKWIADHEGFRIEP